MLNQPQALNDRLSSRRRHLFGFSAVIALALMLVGISFNALHAGGARERAQDWQRHTLEVLLATEKLRSAANETLRGERGYLLTGDAEFLKPYRSGRESTVKHADALRALVRDNPKQRTACAALELQLKRYLATVGGAVTLAQRGESQAAIAMVRSGAERREIEALMTIINRIETAERMLLAERDAAGARAEWQSEATSYTLAALALIFLLIIARAGIAASRARHQALDLEEQLRRAATTDELTGLLNRRAFLAALDVEVARSARSGAPLALALIDLDLFKNVNDRFGHSGGDEVLRKFASTVRKAMRTSDVFGRLGGEEFAMLMPDTDQIQSGIAAERMREAVARRRVVLTSGALVPITVSLGVAHRTTDEKPDRLIARADEALYEAKNSGRNRTRLAA